MNKLNRIAMILAGLVLITASALKIHQMLTEHILSKGFFFSWLFFLITIPLELGMGFWLVSQLFRKAAWLLSVLLFIFFIGLTAYKAAIGEASCGCFGTIQIDPVISILIIDVPLLLLLLIFRPKGEKLFPPPWPHPFHCLAIAIPACFIIGASVPTMAFNKVPDVVKDKQGNETSRVLRPENWQIKPKPIQKPQPVIIDTNNVTTEVNEPNVAEIVEPNIPVEVNDVNEIPIEPNFADIPEWQLMLEHIDIVDDLKVSTKVVFFYHYDCPDCGVAIPLYNEYSTQFASDESIQFAFIEGPPYGDEDENHIPEDTTALLGKLDESRQWIFETPLIFLLQDGDLIAYWHVEYPDLDELIQAMVSTQ